MALALFSKPINSMDRTLAAATIESRKPKEGLWYSKAKLMVGKSYNLRVVVCESYSSLSGPNHAKILDVCLHQVVTGCGMHATSQ